MTVDASLYSDLEYRGILKQVTDPRLETVLKSGPLTLYCGFDPTADSLHVGSLFPLLTLRRFQLAGHRSIAVVGGATGMVGDPSFKAQERALLDDEQLAKNLAGITRVVSRFLDLSGKNAALIANNADWTKGVSYLDFLRDIGKHFTVNHMLGKESVRARLEDREHGISYTEFSYMLLQAFDFLVLNERENCRLQIGGSDQWGNITAGTELIRRMRAARGEITAEARLPLEKEVFGLVQPLIMKADGTKFGKTEKGSVWLDATRTSPYQFYQYFVQTPDADVGTFLKYFTFLPRERIAALEEKVKTAPEKREAQSALASELTTLVHGEAETAKAEKATRALFGDGLEELDEKTLLDVFEGAPSTTLPEAKLDEGGAIALLALVVSTNLCGGSGASRREIEAGGIYVNNKQVKDPTARFERKHFIAGKYLVLRKGKKNYHLVSFA